jgi:hypothetical protein
MNLAVQSGYHFEQLISGNSPFENQVRQQSKSLTNIIMYVKRIIGAILTLLGIVGLMYANES